MLNQKIFKQEIEDWNKNANFYASKNKAPLAKIIDRKISEFYRLSTKERILEAGGGAVLAKNNVTVIDFSPEMIKLARQQNPKANFILGSVHNLPLADEEFDVIVANDLFHHLKAQNLLSKASQEFHRVLKKDGRLCVFERTDNWLPLFFFYFRKPFKFLFTAKGQCSSRNEPPFFEVDLRQILASGFIIERRKYLFSLPFQILAVGTNLIQYLFGQNLSHWLQKKVLPLAGFLEDEFDFKFLCSQQCLVLRKK